MKIISTFLSVLFLSIFLNSTGNAQALFTEDFNYSGAVLGTHGWVNLGGSTTAPLTVTGTTGLSYSTYAGSGVGGAVVLTNNGQDLMSPFTAVTTGSVYASAMVNVSAAQATGDYFFHFTDGTTTNFYGKVSVRVDGSGFDFGVAKQKNTTIVDVSGPKWTSGYAFGGTHLIVIKYTFVAGAGNSTASLFVDPVIGAGEPGTPTLGPTTDNLNTTEASTSTGLKDIQIRQGSATYAPQLTIDGIRVGKAWADVTPSSGPGATFTVLTGLTPFSQTSASPSAVQSYNIIGTGGSSNVTVVPPAGFEISFSSGSEFVNSTSSLTILHADVIAGKTIFVRMNAPTAGSYSGSIIHTSVGSEFTPVTQSVSGTCTAQCVLSLTAFLEGYTNTTSGTVMNYAPSAVKVVLHNSTSPYAAVDSATSSLSTAGVGTFTFTTALNSTPYYIAVKSWNTIETWSNTAQSFTSYALSYDFTSAQTQAYGNNLKQIVPGTKWCIYSGDVNQDGYVNVTDLIAVNNDAFNLVTGYVVTDLTGDLYTNLPDLIIDNNNSYGLVSKNVPSGTTTPVLSLTGTLTAFTQTSSTPSAEQTYSISGTNLTANVTVVPPAGFEISKTTGTGFVSSTGSLVYTAADVMAGKTIYVRLNAGSAGSYSGNITHTSASSEFTVQNLSVSGSYTVISGNVNLIMGYPAPATTDINNPHAYLLVKDVFCASYDRDRGIPNWTSWQLNAAWCNGPAVRQDNYIPDPSLPSAWYHVNDADYSGSGFSRGHMCPSADRINTQADNDSLFYYTNMVPQNQDNNAGDWEGLENYERKLANAGNTLYIISGGYGAGGKTQAGVLYSTISNGHVTVPAQLWKVIIVVPNGDGTSADVSKVTTSTRTIGMLFNNDSVANSMSTWGNYRVSIASIEQLTGFTFFSNVSSSINNVIKANVDTGPTN
jgi:endonuclease G